jgi:hypothetical protein
MFDGSISPLPVADFVPDSNSNHVDESTFLRDRWAATLIGPSHPFQQLVFRFLAGRLCYFYSQTYIPRLWSPEHSLIPYPIPPSCPGYHYVYAPHSSHPHEPTIHAMPWEFSDSHKAWIANWQGKKVEDIDWNGMGQMDAA